MDAGLLGVSEAQVDLLSQAGDFCRARGGAEKARALMESEAGYDPSLWDEIAGLGWLGIAIPESHDGIGLGIAEVTPVVEAMGRYLIAGPFLATTLAAQAVLKGGNEAQRARWLSKLASGTIAAIAIYESHGDWHLDHVEARAERRGRKLRLSGRKTLVAWGEASELIIASVALEGVPVLVLLDTGLLPPGALRREKIIDETKRSSTLTLDGIEIDEDALMPKESAANTLAHLDLCMNLLTAAEMVGGSAAIIDDTADYLKTRKQFGRLIGEYQALKHPLVDAYVDYEKARSHLYAAAHQFGDQGRSEIAVRMAKAQAEKTYSHASDRAIQFHGGFGFTWDCDAHLYRRNAVWNAALGGDAAWQKARLADLLFGKAA